MLDEHATITIFRTSSLEDMPILNDYINQLEKNTKVQLHSEHMPAVVGELAGKAIQIILSDPIQAVKNAAEIGILLWGVLKAIKSVGKHVHLTKKAGRLLLLSKSKEDAISEGRYNEISFEKARVWGPMEIDSVKGPLFEYLSSEVEALVPFAMLMAVIVPIKGDRARTYWNILKADGEILGSWTTQTLISRLPDFLKPL